MLSYPGQKGRIKIFLFVGSISKLIIQNIFTVTQCTEADIENKFIKAGKK